MSVFMLEMSIRLKNDFRSFIQICKHVVHAKDTDNPNGNVNLTKTSVLNEHYLEITQEEIKQKHEVVVQGMIRSIAQRWRDLSGQDDWKDLLDPLDIDLRRYIIHYGQMAQATYDTFNAEKVSKYAGASRYSKMNMFSRVGIEISNPYKYKATRYLYATSQVEMPESFLVKSLNENAWCKDSNWIGYVAVATDGGREALGRRDILVAWRGTIQNNEWSANFDFPLVSASEIIDDAKAQVHRGWLSIYTSNNPESLYSKTSAREQALSEVKRLLDEFQDEEISITVTGHSLGAALGMLNAADLVYNGLNKPRKERPQNKCLVTAFLFACPRVGDSNFKQALSSVSNLHILRTRNNPDIIPLFPMIAGYTEIGIELDIDTRKSNYLKYPGNLSIWHNMEVHLHGVAGTQGPKGDFNLVVKRDISLINKATDSLKDEFLVPVSWWCVKNKGMIQQAADGTWRLEDHEKDVEIET